MTVLPSATVIAGVEYQVAANEGHSLDHRENRVEFMVRVARFLEDNAG